MACGRAPAPRSAGRSAATQRCSPVAVLTGRQHSSERQSSATSSKVGGGIIEEIEGLAAGSGLKVNGSSRSTVAPKSCRRHSWAWNTPHSDVAKARNAVMGLFDIGECTSVAVAGTRCADGHTVSRRTGTGSASSGRT